MRRALGLAARGLGETNPNPAVGCVLVKRGRVVGEGWHRRAGGPHAEVLALRAAGARARGATAYVTLEPCAHHGRTGPCAARLVEARVRRVVAALRDPFPAVDGRGLALLRRSGIEVAVGLLATEAARLNETFLAAARLRRPFVLLKCAATLDGRIATAGGQSKWITSPAQRREARRLRRLYDGVLVGIGTVLADDPGLLPAPRVGRPFHRVVLDSRLRLPPGCRLVRQARSSPVWAICRRAPAVRCRRLERLGVRVLMQRGRGGRVGIRWALRELRRHGVTSLMVEGGSEVLGSFLAERCVDKLALFRAPLLLGGRHGLPAFGGPDPRRLSDALAMEPGPRPRGGLFEVWYPR